MWRVQLGQQLVVLMIHVVISSGKWTWRIAVVHVLLIFLVVQMGLLWVFGGIWICRVRVTIDTISILVVSTFFYIRTHTTNVMSYRVYGSWDLQWFNYIPLPNGLWRRVVIMIVSNEITMYLDGRYHNNRGVSPGGLNWFPGATKLTPRIWLKSTTGNYSFGKLQLWENKKSALFVWRHHYEELEANTMN